MVYVCVWLGGGKGEGMKFTNPEDELDWEEEQKVEDYKLQHIYTV